MVGHSVPWLEVVGVWLCEVLGFFSSAIHIFLKAHLVFQLN